MFYLNRLPMLLLFLLFLPGVVVAQQRVDLRANATQILRELPPIDYSRLGMGDKQERQMLSVFAKALGLEPGKGEELSFLHQAKVPLTGMTTYHLEQRFQGIPVWGERITITTSKNRKARRIGGQAVRALAKSDMVRKAKLTADQALERARKIAGVKQKRNSALFMKDKSKLVVYFDEEGGKSTLAYEVSFSAIRKGVPIRPVYMIDAQNGKVLLEYNDLKQLHGSGPGGNDKTGCYFYGQGGQPFLQIKELGKGLCSLESENVVTWNCHQQTDDTKCTIHSFQCSINKTDKVNGACSPLNDAHFFGHVIFGMYRDWFGIRPLKQQLKMIVHFDKGMENAFWNGTAMFFGDGAKVFYPLVSLDVSSHEIGHGFTEQHSNLIYVGQAGGINESFSDMAGEAAEAYYAEKYLGTSGMAMAASQQPSDQGESYDLATRQQSEQDIGGILTGSGESFIYGDVPGQGYERQGLAGGYGYNGGNNAGGGLGEGGINAILSGAPSPRRGAVPGRRTAPQPDSQHRSYSSNRSVSSYDTAPVQNNQQPKSMFGHKIPDFNVGVDIFKKKGEALRYMSNPPRDGYSIDNAIKYHDEMDVHHSSGVYNKVFYLLASKPGWNVRKAFSVFLVANAAYWTPRENYLSAALKTLDAAKDLNYNVEDVKEAFRAVSIFVNP
jgi:Zn-dependent metalloprotease